MRVTRHDDHPTGKEKEYLILEDAEHWQEGLPHDGGKQEIDSHVQ